MLADSFDQVLRTGFEKKTLLNGPKPIRITGGWKVHSLICVPSIFHFFYVFVSDPQGPSRNTIQHNCEKDHLNICSICSKTTLLCLMQAKHTSFTL